MASDKIVSKITENARSEADQILTQAKENARSETRRIQSETKEKLAQMEKNFKEESNEIERRAKLNAGLEERIDLLDDKRKVLDEAFDRAYEKMKKLPDQKWAKLITEIVLDGVVTGTESLKVPEKDRVRYEKNFMGKGPFLDTLNMEVRSRLGHSDLSLDEEPAPFEEGIMLIGEYSDVNASFGVLLKNQKESIEADVIKILFEDKEV